MATCLVVGVGLAQARHQVRQVAHARANGSFALSSIWAWSCPSHRADMVCIWPGSARAKEAGSDAMVSALLEANVELEAASR